MSHWRPKTCQKRSHPFISSSLAEKDNFVGKKHVLLIKKCQLYAVFWKSWPRKFFTQKKLLYMIWSQLQDLFAKKWIFGISSIVFEISWLFYRKMAHFCQFSILGHRFDSSGLSNEVDYKGYFVSVIVLEAPEKVAFN